MTTYDSVITRAVGDDPLVPQPYVADVIKEATKQSSALQLCRQVRMSSKTSRQPVLSTLPSAYWLSGDTGLKQTSKAEWANVELVAEEAAVIVPVPEAYLSDSQVPIWDEVKPLIGEALGYLLDAAVLFGVSKPSTFGASVYDTANSASNYVTEGSADDLAADVLAAIRKVRADGFSVNGVACAPTFDIDLQGIRTTNGEPIFQTDLTAAGQARVYGYPLHSVDNGAWDDTKAKAIVGDWSKAVLGIRQDISWKVFTEGVISDGSGNVVLNLMQQDSVALRVTARYGFAQANPVTRLNGTEGTRAPFAVLKPNPSS